MSTIHLYKIVYRAEHGALAISFTHGRTEHGARAAFYASNEFARIISIVCL